MIVIIGLPHQFLHFGKLTWPLNYIYFKFGKSSNEPWAGASMGFVHLSVARMGNQLQNGFRS